MSSVGHIFGSEAKVKVMRLFVFNPGSVFTTQTISERVQENISKVRKEVGALTKAGLIKRRNFKKGVAYTLDISYEHLSSLERFLIDAAPIQRKEIVKKLGAAGVLKFVVVSGVFLHDPETRVDLLVVGDHLKTHKVRAAVAGLEAELGTELRYTAFETPDFLYRLGVYDKLVRDILDFPHEKLVNKLNIN